MKTIIESVDKYRINPLDDISEPPAYCTINNRPSLTAGNLSLINGKKKAGKTFLLGALMASTINNSIQIDSIQGCLPNEKKTVLYFDTEQSKFHATRSIKRICKLVDDPLPNNFNAFRLRQLTPDARLDFIEETIYKTPNVGIVAIDGIRDLLTRGINDEQEATRLSSSFLMWTDELEIHLFLLLHQNKNDLNARGHIGSEIVNKAETVISVTKEEKNNVFRVICEDSRDIPFDDFGFTISKDGLPIPCDLPDAKIRKITDPTFIPNEEHLNVLSILFKEVPEYTADELKIKLGQEFDFGRDAILRFISYYIDNKWLIKDQRGRNIFYRYNVSATSFFYHSN
jgi:hypothetical protein